MAVLVVLCVAAIRKDQCRFLVVRRPKRSFDHRVELGRARVSHEAITDRGIAASELRAKQHGVQCLGCPRQRIERPDMIVLRADHKT